MTGYEYPVILNIWSLAEMAIMISIKKILLIVSVLITIHEHVSGQVVTDTTTYLKDHIYSENSEFLGMPMRDLFEKLKINVRHSSTAVIIGQVKSDDTTKLEHICLYFNDIKTIALNSDKSSFIRITFTTPVSIPSSYFKVGNLLDWSSDWNSVKQQFFSQDKFVIGKIQVFSKGVSWGY